MNALCSGPLSSRLLRGFNPLLAYNLGWEFEHLAVSIIRIQRCPCSSTASLLLKVQLGTPDKSVHTQERFLGTNGKPHDGTGRQVGYVDGVGSTARRSEFWVRMDLCDVKTLKLAPAVSVPDLHFEWMENIWIGGVVCDFESHGGYIGEVCASDVPNRDVLRGPAGKGKENGEQKKECAQKRAGKEHLRFHAKSIPWHVSYRKTAPNWALLRSAAGVNGCGCLIRAGPNRLGQVRWGASYSNRNVCAWEIGAVYDDGSCIPGITAIGQHDGLAARRWGDGTTQGVPRATDHEKSRGDKSYGD